MDRRTTSNFAADPTSLYLSPRKSPVDFVGFAVAEPLVQVVAVDRKQTGSWSPGVVVGIKLFVTGSSSLSCPTLPPLIREPASGVLPRTAYRFVWRPQKRMEPVRIDRHIADAETLPIAGGLHAVHIPGHCAGQVAFLWQGEGERPLIAGDVGMNILGLGDPVGFEDIEEGRRSQRKVATLRFNAAVFGRGRPIHSGASEHIRCKWGR